MYDMLISMLIYINIEISIFNYIKQGGIFMKFRKYIASILIGGVMLMSFTGCSSSAEIMPEKTANLNGHELFVYCGAGMKVPFQDIADKFQEVSGCEMTVNFANAAQIQNQINTTKEGDFFIAGSKEELKPVEELVTESIDLVKHIPVLAVQKGNPKNILSLKDLTNDGVRLVLGDAESTPIGKVANKALKDISALEKVNIVSRTLTAPPMAMALENDECDAAIIWKENVNSEKLEITAKDDLEKYVKIVPAASLSSSVDSKASEAFIEFLKTDEAKNIWQENGYEIAE